MDWPSSRQDRAASGERNNQGQGTELAASKQGVEGRRSWLRRRQHSRESVTRQQACASPRGGCSADSSTLPIHKHSKQQTSRINPRQQAKQADEHQQRRCGGQRNMQQ